MLQRDLALTTVAECHADGYVVEEARRNLIVKAPAREAALQTLLRRMKVADAHPSGPVPEAALVLPEKDRPVLSAAIPHRCDALVTGDRTHFGRFYGKTLGVVVIHSPRSLADRLFE